MHKILFPKIIFVFLLSVLLMTSCSENEEVVPVGIIEPAKMTEIFVDMQITESVLLHIQQKGIQSNLYRKTLYDKIFEKYKITKSGFDSSFSYYTKNNVKLLDKIYAEVITSLNQKQSKIKVQ